MRKAITKKLRFEIFKRDSFTCQYCGRAAPTVVLNVDHINPVKHGGRNDILNLITSCFDCNSGKRHRKLNDSAVLEKQLSQLEELNERRNQIELMLKWREEVKKIDENSLSIAIGAINLNLFECEVNDSYIKKIKSLIKKNGLKMFWMRLIFQQIDI